MTAMGRFGQPVGEGAASFRCGACGEILSGEGPDPAVLRRIDWKLAPFYCPECDQNYCRADWHTSVLVDDGFYDCTTGTCPGGHKHMVDD